MSNPIPQEVLDKAHRALLRRLAAIIAEAMAQSDVDFATAAKMLGRTESGLRRWYMRLLDGKGAEMREACELATAMGGQFRFDLEAISPWDKKPRTEQIEPEKNQDQGQSS